MKLNDINYSSVNNDSIFMHGTDKITNSSNVDNNGNYNVTKIERKGTAYPVINAIDIDWNGAEVEEGKYINTTSDLIKWIKESSISSKQLQLLDDLQNIIEIIKQYFNENHLTKYYWYVGNNEPNSLSNPDIEEGWTSLLSKPTQIKIFREEQNYNDVQWYLAAPAEWGFVTSYNGIQVGGWTKTIVTINDIPYNVWTCQALTDTVNVTLANI